MVRAEAGIAGTVAGLSLTTLDLLDVPVIWVPLVAVPVVIAVGVHRWVHVRVRRRGGRFSGYDSRHMPGD